MKWKHNEATLVLEKLFKLEKSYSKLDWYVKKYQLLRGIEGEIINFKNNETEIIKRIDLFKGELHGYEKIVNEASDKFTQPIRNISGVYFLIDSSKPEGKEIVYVGQAKSIMNRLSGHFWKVEKNFDRVYYIELDIKVLVEIESYYIWHLEYPVYNKDAGKNDHLVRKMLELAKLYPSKFE